MNDDFDAGSKAPRARVERRAHQRVRVRVAVEIESVASFFGFSADVSIAGICVVADEELPVGSLVDLEFQIPPEEPPVDALGEIQWKRPVGPEQIVFAYGIEFLDISEVDECRLADLVQQRTPLIEANLTSDEDS